MDHREQADHARAGGKQLDTLTANEPASLSLRDTVTGLTRASDLSGLV